MVNGRPVNAAGRFLRAEHAIYPSAPQAMYELPELEPELSVEQATALNMERAARLVTKGRPPEGDMRHDPRFIPAVRQEANGSAVTAVTVGNATTLNAPRITTGPMPAPPQTVVTHHAPPIVPEPFEPSQEDYGAVLDPELADELRALGLHPDQLANPALMPPPAFDLPPPTATPPPSPQSPAGGGVPPPPGLPTAATLTYGRTGYRLTKLVGHQAVQSWSFDAPADLMAEVLAGFGITVVDLTREDESK